MTAVKENWISGDSYTHTAANAVAAEVNNSPRVVLFDGSWPARSSADAVTFFVGGTAAPTDMIDGDVWLPIDDDTVGLDDTQTLTNKTLTSPKINAIKDTNGANLLGFSATASAVNYLYLQNKAAGGSPSIDAAGTDSNIDMNITPKGTGVVKANNVEVATISGTQTFTNKTVTSPKINSIKDTNGNNALDISATSTAVNYMQVTNATAGNHPGIQVVGTNTNISFVNKTKGTGDFNVQDAAGNFLFNASTTASPVNYPYTTNSATGSPATFGVWGTDTNVGLNLTTKGAGLVTANSKTVGTWVTVPSTATSTGVTGQMAADTSWLYICTATNTWRRVAIASW